jgi:hypothetical protein
MLLQGQLAGTPSLHGPLQPQTRCDWVPSGLLSGRHCTSGCTPKDSALGAEADVRVSVGCAELTCQGVQFTFKDQRAISLSQVA